MNFDGAKKEALEILNNNLDASLYYHSVGHTLDVLEACTKLATLEGVKGEDLILLQTAALFHDTGYSVMDVGHEEVSVSIAQDKLSSLAYTKEQIDAISRAIFATKIPQSPDSLLGEILCDADLDYLGRDDYYELAEKLGRELEERNHIEKNSWVELQLTFLGQHKYFTPSARRFRQESKNNILQELARRSC